MKKGATLFAVLWAVLGLGLLVGLPVAIHFILGQYDEAGFSGPQLVFEEQGHSYLAFTLDDYRANEVDNGVVHGSSRSYAQVVDLEDGSLRWSMRLDADNERGDDWGSGELLGQSSRYLFFLRNELYVLDRRDAAPALAFDELERRTGGLPLKSAPWGKDAYRYDEGRGGLLMLALDGRVWFLDGDSLALREAPEVDAARYFHGDPPPASAGIAWQAPGLTRLPDGRLLILASDHEARALERGEALPAANQRARRQRLSLGTLDWRSPAENRLRPLLDAAFLQAGLLLVILNAWALLYAGRLAEAEDCIGQLARFLPMPSASRQRVLLAQWQGLFGILLHCRGERGAADYLREALEQLPEDAWSQGLICRSALMQLAMIEGRMDQARLIGRDALRLAREHDSLIFEALIELERAQWLEQRGELLRAEGVLDRAQRYLEDLGQQGSPMLGRIALRRARLCLQQGREVEAGHWYRLGLEQARENLDPWVLYGYLGLALLEAGQGDLDAAFNRLLEVERLMQQRHVPDPLYRGALLLVSSALTLQQGRPAQAREILLRVRAYFQPGRARLSPPSEPELEARVEHQLALAELYSGEAAAAEARLRGLLAILEAQGRQTLLCEVRMGIAECQFLSGQLPQAQQTLRSGLELAERLGLQLPQRRLRDRQPQLFAALPGEEEEGLSPLSCRELAVLGLIAQGCSNQEIGEQLFISLHTVKTHARRINGKLGVARRTQAVARAKALGLLALSGLSAG
ncbi:PA2928 family protein, partial [Pseudomonas aeruginosa]